MIFAQQLQQKKEKLEKLLADKIWDRNYFAEKEKENVSISQFSPATANKGDAELEIECIQNSIDQIDSELRKEKEIV